MTVTAIGVGGGGAWGTAPADVAARAGRSVTLWLRDPQAGGALRSSRRHPALPALVLHPGVRPTVEMDELAACGALLLVTPAQTTGEVTARLAAVLPTEAPLVICAKPHCSR